MAEIIQEIFCDPPMAIARLGGSTAPLEAYSWTKPPNPRTDSETIITPDWSLRILPGGTVEPHKPASITFRDGNLIRPVCPFIEVHARLGEPGSDPSTWKDAPLTPELLASAGVTPAAVRLTITARNRKAARRRQNPALIFGTFPAVSIAGDQHLPVPLDGVSPPAASPPMIPSGRLIPLGNVQIMQSAAQPAPGSVTWPSTIDISIFRFRFTPALGRFYGPPQAAIATRESPVPAVELRDSFLDPGAGWFGQPGLGGGFVEPADTFDETGPRTAVSLGVVDDTCEVHIDVTLTLPGRPPGAAPLIAQTTVFVAPPDFAPDRRPFLSLADELNDRAADAATRTGLMTVQEQDSWVQDLFERVYETVSLMNVDRYRSENSMDPLPDDAMHLVATPIPGDGVLPDTQAMGSRDALRNRNFSVLPASIDVPLPLSQHARIRHRALSNIDSLRALAASDAKRLGQLVRGPFEAESGENGRSTTMRMPPFMMNSNANPLTLAAWQYALLMQWADRAGGPAPAAMPVVADSGGPAPLSPAAAARRDAVLARLGSAGP